MIWAGKKESFLTGKQNHKNKHKKHAENDIGARLLVQAARFPEQPRPAG